MATISSTELKPIFTTLIAAKYDELLKIRPTGFLRAMFKDNVTKVRFPGYEVRRGSEQVGVDVMMGHQGIRTQITKATQKVLDPFYFRYWFDATENDWYWNLFGSSSFNENVMTEAVNGVMVHHKFNQDLIDRAYEVFCSQVLEFGTCTSFNDASIINFNRKAGSMVDTGAGTYWATNGVIPYDQIAEGCQFIRQYGKYNGGVYNLLLGATAFGDLMNNSVVLSRNDIKMWKLDDIVTPQQNIEGQTYHGTISCGPYTVHLWQYPQFYDMPGTLVKTPYINPKKVILTIPNPEFQTIYAATPQVSAIGAATNSLVAGKYILQEAVFEWERSHKFGIESRGIPVPIAIDTLYTRQVAA